MTDCIDRAQALDEMQRENAIACHKAKQVKALMADNGRDVFVSHWRLYLANFE